MADERKKENGNTLKFTIVEEIAVLSESRSGWRKELNVVRWADKPPKFDIRSWSPDHTRMGKGVTLTDEEFEKLRDAIMKM